MSYFIELLSELRLFLQAFVIYCFFQLLVGYLGGERSLLIRVHGRQPKPTPFPMNVFQPEIDVSDPFTFLFLKRGILRKHLIPARFSRHDLNPIKNMFKSSQSSRLLHLR